MQYLAHPFGSYADAADYHPFWMYSPRWYHPLIECWQPLFSGILSLILLLRRDISTDLNSGPGLIVLSSLLLPSAPLYFCRHRFWWVGVRLLGESCVRRPVFDVFFDLLPSRRLHLQMQIGQTSGASFLYSLRFCPPGRLSYTPGNPVLRLRYSFIFLFGNRLVEANLRRACLRRRNPFVMGVDRIVGFGCSPSVLLA